MAVWHKAERKQGRNKFGTEKLADKAMGHIFNCLDESLLHQTHISGW